MEKNKNNQKKISTFRRVISIILLIVLLPLVLFYLFFKKILKHARYKLWQKEEMTGKKLLLSSDITTIDIMEGYEFEAYLKAMFFYAGFDVTVTQKSRDYGADLLLRKNNETIIVQAKRYNKQVGMKSVQEILGAVNHYGAAEAWVITNNYFSPQAETLAKENGVRLIDRDELVLMSKEICKKLSIDNESSSIIGAKSILHSNKLDGRSLEEKFPHMI